MARTASIYVRIAYHRMWKCELILRLWCQKQESQIWMMITYPCHANNHRCLRYLLRAPKSSYKWCNNATHVFCLSRKSDTSPDLKDLHSCQLSKIEYKMLLLTYKGLHGNALHTTPSYSHTSYHELKNDQGEGDNTIVHVDQVFVDLNATDDVVHSFSNENPQFLTSVG